MTRMFDYARRQMDSWLRSSSIAGQTEAERSSERNRRLLASSLAGLALRGSSFVVILVSVPLTLDLLGPVRFGLWMTIASVVALLGATDLGIGYGLLNNLSRAYGHGDQSAARQTLASGFAVLSVMALAIGAVFFAVYAVIPWANLYNVTSDVVAASEAGPATAVFVATFLIGLPLGVVGQVRAAYQEGFVQSAFSGFGNALTIALLVVAVAARASLPILVLSIAVGPLIAASANLIALAHTRPWLMPRRRHITGGAMASVLGVGLAFMVLQIAYTIGFSMDRLILAHVVSPAAVADYSVVYRLFSIPAALASIASLPLWPAYREAMSRQDMRWVRVTLRRSLGVTMIATVPLALGLAIAGPSIVAVWTSGSVSPPNDLYFALGAFTMVYALANTFGMVLNGAQAMRYLIGTWCLMAIVNVIASVYLASRIGVTGVAVGSVFAVVVALLVPAMFYVPRMLQRMDDRRIPPMLPMAVPDGTGPMKPDVP